MFARNQRVVPVKQYKTDFEGIVYGTNPTGFRCQKMSWIVCVNGSLVSYAANKAKAKSIAISYANKAKKIVAKHSK